MTGFDAPPPPAPFPPAADRRPRPAVTVGATLVTLGGALMIAGSILHWFDLDHVTYNGFTSGLEGVTNVKGGIFDVLGVVVLGFGITQLLAKKVIALGIIGAVLSALALLVGLKALSDINDLVDLGRLFGADVSTGPGLYVAVAGGILGTIGSIATVVKQSA